MTNFNSFLKNIHSLANLLKNGRENSNSDLGYLGIVENYYQFLITTIKFIQILINFKFNITTNTYYFCKYNVVSLFCQDSVISYISMLSF